MIQKNKIPENWRPIVELPAGHYAVGRDLTLREFDIFCGRDRVLWDTRTGDRVPGITGWRRA